MVASLPSLGAGLGYRPRYRAGVFLHRPEIDFLEITADHYLHAPRGKQAELDLLASHFTLIPHGLDLSLGSADGLDRDYLGKLAALVRSVRAPWWSEHVAMTRAGGVQIGHLAPLPFTREAVDVVCRNIAHAQSVIDTPLILENITYDVRFPGAEMTEAQFLGEIAERTGCGLLLDVTNLHTNSVNHGFDAVEALAALPLDRVVQLHFAGGYWEGGRLIDSHSRPVMPETWSLMNETLRRAPNVRGVILERDEKLPAFDELLDDIARARDAGRRHGRWN